MTIPAPTIGTQMDSVAALMALTKHHMAEHHGGRREGDAELIKEASNNNSTDSSKDQISKVSKPRKRTKRPKKRARSSNQRRTEVDLEAENFGALSVEML